MLHVHGEPTARQLPASSAASCCSISGQAQHGRTCHTSSIAPSRALELIKDFRACIQHVTIQLGVQPWLQRCSFCDFIRCMQLSGNEGLQVRGRPTCDTPRQHIQLYKEVWYRACPASKLETVTVMTAFKWPGHNQAAYAHGVIHSLLTAQSLGLGWQSIALS